MLSLIPVSKMVSFSKEQYRSVSPPNGFLSFFRAKSTTAGMVFRQTGIAGKDGKKTPFRHENPCIKNGLWYQ